MIIHMVNFMNNVCKIQIINLFKDLFLVKLQDLIIKLKIFNLDLEILKLLNQ